ncbi:uncharacterized protein ARMOST_18969 [Armillaria ostoyae]|uniref:Uncharacterized protein n=1 Tax=Armillaria ostoyae TaxID=47428 RepID=A0A284S384_ARMOS|nr:uncharacterized protein ARMOST_18969 [Armillaria ostoyae]
MPKSPTKASSKTQADTEYAFNFGRYNGQTICEVPRDYIAWCKRKGLLNERPDLRDGVRQYESLTLDQKEQLVKEKVSPWLWDAYYDRMANHDMTLRRRELERMRTILMQKFHLNYPLRPETEQTELYSESASMRALNALLAVSRARRILLCVFVNMDEFVCFDSSIYLRGNAYQCHARKRKRKCDNACERTQTHARKCTRKILRAPVSPRRPAHAAQLTPEEWKYLSFHVDPISHEGMWAWQPEYEIQIKAALDSVREEHGQGGLEVARWAVRDKSAQCVSGIIGYQGDYCYQWFDQSTKWFEEDPKAALDRVFFFERKSVAAVVMPASPGQNRWLILNY